MGDGHYGQHLWEVGMKLRRNPQQDRVIVLWIVMGVAALLTGGYLVRGSSGDTGHRTMRPGEISLIEPKLRGRVDGTKYVFSNISSGEMIEFDVILPINMEDEERFRLDVNIQPTRTSIRRGSLAFVSDTGRITLLPGRRVLSQPDSGSAACELEFRCRMDVHFLAEKESFKLLLNCATPVNGERVSYRDYGILSFPVRQEGIFYLARVRIEANEDFQGDIGYWKYTTASYLF
jgi:hypothetical protein